MMTTSGGRIHLLWSLSAIITALLVVISNATDIPPPPQLLAPSSAPAVLPSLAELFSQANSSENLADEDSLVKITLYYETLCPYSVKFIKGQLYPVYSALKKYVQVQLVPYGNAKTIQNPDGSFDFKCQHGPQECLGNTVHACAIAHIPIQDKLMSFIKCAVGKKKGFGKKGKKVENSAKQCAKVLNIDFPPIEACYKGTQGIHLEIMYGNQTNALVPPLKGVPWVLFNDVYDDQKEDAALDNLLSVVCQLISGTKPSACPTYNVSL